ncbi:hypothetical protein PVK06_024570 [Gossypium arboreum]|uniref:Uncharacterized protein n=1 Tax=Gossypium arboreum TaxID=29729 RepID=A0ABR0PEG2_GOSAR|nr:hypothetical protein PVK06_024570 [Gossypium arboreum]
MTQGTLRNVPIVEEEVDVGEKEVHIVVVKMKVEEENTEKESAENIVNTFGFVGATTDNLE